MPRTGKNSESDPPAGDGPAQPDRGRADSGLERLASDPENWGEPLSYVELLTDPSVQSRIARLIVQSALKRPRHGR